MFTPSYPRRPRPPGARRSQLSSPPGQAGPLPTKMPLASPSKAPKSTPSPMLAKRKGKMRAEPQASSDASPPPLRTRPLSMLSETSVASPPPPYRRGLTESPKDSKDELQHSLGGVFPPPPPDPLESGPSSVRTSLIELEHVEDDMDTDEEAEKAGDTLTLRGLRRLLKQNEMDSMSAEVSVRLGVYGDTPYYDTTAKLPSVIGTSSPISAQPSPERYTLPSDADLAFSYPQRRAAPVATKPGQRLSLIRADQRAEEDDARIAALEALLLESREGEEATRKANARLRRDNSKLRQQLEDAEDAVAEQMEQDTWTAQRPSDTESVRSSISSPPPRRSRGSYPPQDDERIGWGSTAFPEFPRTLGSVDDWEATSESTTRPVSCDPSPESVSEAVMAEPLSLPDSHTNAAPQDEHWVPASEAPTVMFAPSRGGSFGPTRPAVSANTFLSPTKVVAPTPVRAPLTPQLTIHPASRPGSADKASPLTSPTQSSFSSRIRRSPYPSPRTYIRHERSVSASITGTGPHRRTLSFSKTPLKSPSPESGMSAQASPSHLGFTPSPMSAFASVRSYLSDYLVHGRRTLGSELGSNYSPSPERRRGSDCSCSDYQYTPQFTEPPRPSAAVRLAALAIGLAEAKLTGRISNLSQQSVYGQYASSSSGGSQPYRTPSHRHSSPPGTFVFPADNSASDVTYQELYGSDMRRIHWAPDAKEPRAWSPHSWPSPSPSPCEANLPDISDDESDGPHIFTDSLYEDGTIAAPRVPVIGLDAPTPVAHVGPRPPMADTPSPAHLAPNVDPWDEYSDRATPSPRPHALRPLFLLSTPAVHARSTSLTLVHHRRSGSGAQYPLPYPLMAYGNAAAHRRAYSMSASPQKSCTAGPVTIPARVTHDFFCLVLLLLDYMEWAVIIMYRLFADIRAGPSAAVPKPRSHANRYYL